MSQSYESAPQAPPGPPPGGPSGPRAGFGARLGAFLLDGIIVGVAGGILFFVLAAISDVLGVLGYVIWIVGGIAYYIYFEGGETGATLGKKAVNIRVIDAQTGGQVGYGKAALRYVGRILSSIPIYLGYFWMLWDGEKQTWHDKIAGTYVVPTDAYR
jgi:uncharacterized RDD family membrane protein YckC